MFHINLVIVLSISAILCAESRPTSDADEISKKLKDEENVQRLRQMFLESHKLATASLHEHNVLRQIQKHFNEHVGGNLDASGVVKPEESENVIILFDDQRGPGKYPPVTGQSKENLDAAKDVIVVSDVDEQAEKSSSITHSKQDARQSSFFSNLKLPGNPVSNPIMGGFSMPTFPPMPTLPVFTPRPPRPPKSSIIGNNGGSMALTNDNVVVVNVLSGNY